MAKIKVNNYVFDKTARTVTFSDFGSVRLDSILLVANTTTNTFIYNPVVAGLGGTVASNVLTFEFDSSTMSNTDKLLIYYDDAAAASVNVTNVQLPTNAATETKQDVLIAKDFATQTTLASVLAKLITSPSTEAKQDTGNSSLSTIASKDFATQTTLAALLAKVIAAPSTESKQNTIITDLGAVDETAPVTDTASSGLNGRLQRIAQRLTSLIALVPGSLGQKVMASSFAVTIASDQSDLPVSIGSIALPTGASTSAKQDLLLTELQLKADLTETQPVSLASLPALTSGSAIIGKISIDQTTPGTTNAVAVASSALPTGASTETTSAAILAKIITSPATEAKQDTGNSSLSTIAAKDFATETSLAALLAKIIAAPATETKQDTVITAVGGVTETAPGTDTASSGLNGRLQRVAQRLTSLIALVPTSLGQKTMAGSLAVTVASDQSTIAVSAASLPLPTGAALEAGNLATIVTDLGGLTETAPGTDTASSGLNGRLQRVAQRITSLIALLPTALGQGTMATSLKVVLPSDQSSIPVAATLSAETTKVIGTVTNSSNGHSATVTITRPSNTTAYTAGDVIGDTNGSAIFTFASMIRAAGEVEITSIEYEVDESARPSGMDMFDVRLYNASPTAIADNAVFDIPSGDRGKYLGKVRIGVPIDEGSTLFIDNDCIGKQITLSSTSLYVILQTVGAYTPTSAGVSRLTIHTRDI